MAGIGDYVHARLLRLDKYGLSTGPDTKDLVINHSDFISSITQQNHWVDNNTLKEKAKALEQIYNLKTDKQKQILTEKQFDNINQDILKQIEKTFPQYIGKIKITREGKCELNVDSDAYKPLQIGALNDQLAYNTIEKLIQLGDKIDALQRTIKNNGEVQNQAGEKALYTRNELQKDKSKLLKVFRQWFDGLAKNSGWASTKNHIQNLQVTTREGKQMPIKEFLNTYSMRGKGINKSAGEGRVAPIIKDGVEQKETITEEMIKDCNELIAKYAKYTPLATIQGIYNELYAKMMPEFVAKNVNKVSKNLLQKLGKNMQLTHVATNSSTTNILQCVASDIRVGDDVKITDFQKAVKTAIVSAEAKASIENYSSTSKADVVLEWDSNKISNKAGISIKSMSHNSDGYKYIKLVDGTNLLYYMGNWKIPFANTFLNLFATHVDDNNTSRANYFKKAKQTVSSFAVQTIVIQALTGYNLGREGSHMAQLFAYRNVESGKWIVVPTATIINRIMYNINEIGFLNTEGKLGLKVEIGGNTIDKLKLNNAWIGDINKPNYNDAMTRLAALIANTHSKKIYVSIQFSKYVRGRLK